MFLKITIMTIPHICHDRAISPPALASFGKKRVRM